MCFTPTLLQAGQLTWSMAHESKAPDIEVGQEEDMAIPTARVAPGDESAASNSAAGSSAVGGTMASKVSAIRE